MLLFEKYNPIQYYLKAGWRITSNYGPRIHPISKKQSHHNGVDLVTVSGPRNVPTPTPYNCTVFRAQFYNSRGFTVVARIDGTNQMMLFQHLGRIDVRVGQKLRIGQSVGLCGTSGDSTGIHLHFEIRKFNGRTDMGDGLWGNPNNYYYNNSNVRDIWKELQAKILLRRQQ